jgi:hypothetical protein
MFCHHFDRHHVGSAARMPILDRHACIGTV